MNKINFNVKNKLIWNHLSINKAMIIFFTVFYFLVTLALLSMGLIKYYDFVKFPYIAPTSIHAEIDNGHGSHGSYGIISWSIYSSLSTAIYSVPGITIFLIANIYLINKIIIKELNEGQISIWMSFSFSRFKVIFSKILTIFIINLIIFSFSFILIIIFSSFAQDSKQYIGFVFMYSLQFITFIILLVSILIIFSILFNQKSVLLNVVFGLFIFWILSTWILNLVYDLSDGTIKMLKYVKFISPQSLLLPVMNFGSENVNLIEEYEYGKYKVTIKQATLKEVLWAIKSTVLILLMISIVVINYFSIRIFKNKDIKI
ncbi:ABC transporter permease subunit [Spiroplasma endosymbiont of Diplazon laetatorius]|uniref:ABC transporter permease subunit n=1 Tax=Spiroplasma endosymbiont of Diplazon laetatorius TaxID=3066322 RepID=UPI0030D12EC6